MNKKLIALVTLALAGSLVLTGCGKTKDAKVEDTTTATETTTDSTTDNAEGNTDGSMTGNDNGSVAPKPDPVPADAVFAKSASEASTAFVKIITTAVATADKAAAGKAPTLDQYMAAMSKINTEVSFTKLQTSGADSKFTFTGESGKFKCSIPVSFSSKSTLGAVNCK